MMWYLWALIAWIAVVALATLGIRWGIKRGLIDKDALATAYSTGSVRGMLDSRNKGEEDEGSKQGR